MLKISQWPPIAVLMMVPCALIAASTGDGKWRSEVPEAARSRPNPMAGNSDAILAGAKLFQQNCASCHGKQAEGRLKRPSLRSDRLKSATAGELEWLLKNGRLKNGMPSWSRLPEPQRWQLVTFLKSLD
jgi:mono/diheme cytochrome c family protein